MQSNFQSPLHWYYVIQSPSHQASSFHDSWVMTRFDNFWAHAQIHDFEKRWHPRGSGCKIYKFVSSIKLKEVAMQRGGVSPPTEANFLIWGLVLILWEKTERFRSFFLKDFQQVCYQWNFHWSVDWDRNRQQSVPDRAGVTCNYLDGTRPADFPPLFIAPSLFCD